LQSNIGSIGFRTLPGCINAAANITVNGRPVVNTTFVAYGPREALLTLRDLNLNDG
jgi:hypothetical protein